MLNNCRHGDIHIGTCSLRGEGLRADCHRNIIPLTYHRGVVGMVGVLVHGRGAQLVLVSLRYSSHLMMQMGL